MLGIGTRGACNSSEDTSVVYCNVHPQMNTVWLSVEVTAFLYIV